MVCAHPDLSVAIRSVLVALPDGLKSIARVCELEDWLTSVAA